MTVEQESSRAHALEVPSTVKAFDSAVANLPGGRFIEELIRPGVRPFFACLYGGPFFGLAKLAPELFERPQINLVFGGALGQLPYEGGRWLSLYRKALPYEGRISCTLCAAAKPNLRRTPRKLLVQPPQSIVVKPWARQLRETDGEPDALLLYPPSSFDKYTGFIEDLTAARQVGKILIACRARAEMHVLQRLLKAYGFVVRDNVGFPCAEGEVRALEAGAWWLSVDAGDVEPQQPDEKELERLRSVESAYRAALGEATDFEHFAAIATAYGQRTALHVADEHVPDAVLVSEDEGVDLTTGRWFRGGHSKNGADATSYTFDGRTLSAAILGLVPQIKSGEPTAESEFRLLAWLARAKEVGGAVSDESLAIGFEDAEIPALADKVTSASDEVPAPADAGTSGQSAAIDPSQKRTSVDAAVDSISTTARLRSPRSRLSRNAGTVNVLGIAARLGPETGNAEQSYEIARSRILKWVANKGFGEVPIDANYHIETSEGEISVETDGAQNWAMRFDDRKQMEGGAFWRVELALIRASQPALGLRLYQVRRSEAAPAPVSGVPKVVAAIANDVGLSDCGVPLLPKAWRLAGEAGAQQLFRILLNKDRVQPLIVVSTSQGIIPEASMDRLAERLVAAAHVALIDNVISDELIRQFGRDRSVFGSAIRIYRPGFTAESDPFQHRIWTYAGSQLSPYLTNDIAEEVCATSLEGADFEHRVPSFVSIRNQINQVRLKALRRQAEKVAATAEEERAQQLKIQKSLEVELKQLREWVAELEASNKELDSENKTLVRERDAALDQYRQLRHLRDVQLEQQYTIEDRELDGTPWYPESWDLLEDWVESYGDGKVILLASAAKAARQSDFHVELSYKALELLAKYYVPMRQRNPDDDEPWRRFNQALDELGLECTQTGDATEQHRYKKDYQRIHNGRSITLDMHLKRGAGFDPAVVFRLYFHYDENAGQVIVGHLPSHLTNSKSH